MVEQAQSQTEGSAPSRQSMKEETEGSAALMTPAEQDAIEEGAEKHPHDEASAEAASGPFLRKSVVDTMLEDLGVAPPDESAESSPPPQNSAKTSIEEAEEATTPLFADDPLADMNNAPIELVVSEWANGTSIHGVAEISDSVKWKCWKRMVWLFLVITSAGFMLWQIDVLLETYGEFNVVTETDTVVPDSLEFPEITFCNRYTFSESLQERHDIQEPANLQELLLISPPVDDFIVAASFNDESLNVTTAFEPVITDFGQCWRFRSNERIVGPGIFGGLEVFFFLGQDQYSESEFLATVLLWAQQPGTQISEQLPVVTASPGRETVVSLTMEQFDRDRDEPWSHCHSEAPAYSQLKCRTECIHAGMVQQCGCRRYGDDRAPDDIPYCREDSIDANCTDQFYKNTTQVLHECSCALPPCEETVYTATVTHADFSRAFVEDTQTAIEQIRNDGGGLLNGRTRFEYNFVGVHINFGQIQYRRYTEEKSLTFAQLLASIGGSMGLFLGISFLSIFEVFGDFLICRLLPRWLCGQRHLYGIGVKENSPLG